MILSTFEVVAELRHTPTYRLVGGVRNMIDNLTSSYAATRFHDTATSLRRRRMSDAQITSNRFLLSPDSDEARVGIEGIAPHFTVLWLSLRRDEFVVEDIDFHVFSPGEPNTTLIFCHTSFFAFHRKAIRHLCNHLLDNGKITRRERMSNSLLGLSWCSRGGRRRAVSRCMMRQAIQRYEAKLQYSLTAYGWLDPCCTSPRVRQQRPRWHFGTTLMALDVYGVVAFPDSSVKSLNATHFHGRYLYDYLYWPRRDLSTESG
ncbi:hypothetical protein EVAR_28459_1 [Eumeta japonica]|uniref:Uncharacterized protein n=1 Tax=Eumeta variegata TaxID=151549 RepID=A0A4C1VAL9_EUMVA|nr:hypothetical protein EVAR_28459_1 [Eumeta japonica]